MFNILLVDDSATDRFVIGKLLDKHEHFVVDQAEDGAIALEKMRAKLPDVVLTDMQMPNIDGLQLVERIRELYPHVPVILITGAGSEDLAALALQRGAAGYVPKSRASELLQSTIEHVLELKRSEFSFKRVIDSAKLCQFEFAIENDPTLIAPLLELAQRVCSGLKICDETGCVQIGVALEHAILNAMFHGNLEIGTNSIDNPTLLKQRVEELPHNKRRVFIEMQIKPDKARFVVRDEGSGFNVKEVILKGRQMALTGDAGRGLFLMWSFMDSVTFENNGNAVVMFKRRAPESPTPFIAGTAKSELPSVLGILKPHERVLGVSSTKPKLSDITNRLSQLSADTSSALQNEDEFIELLGKFPEQLAYRLAIGEALGYFEEAIEAASRNHRQTEALQTQFAELHTRARSLAVDAADPEKRNLESLSKSTRNLLQELRLHDNTVAEMVMDCMFQDIGGGD